MTDRFVGFIEPTRLDPISYIIITNKYATLYELKYKYNIEEVLDIYEAVMINIHNKSVVVENKK